jgi:protein-disulfide isomerase-like protein with CxxC motif
MVAQLDANAQGAFMLFLNRLDEMLGDDRYIVFEGRRTQAVQEAYYAQGREGLQAVNALRAKAGLYLLRSERDNARPITWTLKSRHIDGCAMDVLPLDGRGHPTWDLAHYRTEFETIRNGARAAGLVCGADWQTPDWPHYETQK